MKNILTTLTAVLVTIGLSAQNMLVTYTTTDSLQNYYNKQAKVSFWGQANGEEQNGDLTVTTTHVGGTYVRIKFHISDATAFINYGIHISSDGQEWKNPYSTTIVDESAIINYTEGDDAHDSYHVGQLYSKGITEYTVTGLQPNTTYYIKPYASVKTYDGKYSVMFGTEKQIQTNNSTEEEVWSTEFPDAVPEDEEEYYDILNNCWAEGKYTYGAFISGSYSQSVLRRYSLTDPSKVQFCLFNWCYGVNLIIDADYSKKDPETGQVPLSIAPQSIGYHMSGYDEDVMVSDMYSYWHDFRGKDISPDLYSSYYDEVNGRFVLNVAYYISIGYFGQGEEILQLDGYTPSAEALYGENALKEDDGTFTQKIGIVKGEHIPELRYALVKGNLSDDEISEVLNKMQSKTVDDFIKYGEITDEEIMQVNLSMSEEGDYTFVILPFNSKNERKNEQTLHFRCPKQHWVDRHVGTYTHKYYFSDYDNTTWIPREQKGLILQQDTENPTQWRIKNWGDGTYLLFTHNEDGSITVGKQPIGDIGSDILMPTCYPVVYTKMDGNGSVYNQDTETYYFDVLYAPKEIGKKQIWIYGSSGEDRGFETFVISDLDALDEDETIDIANEIDEDTNLDGSIVGDIYYSISSNDGGYDAAEGCIVVNKTTDDSAIENNQNIFGEDFNTDFTGIVFKVPAGSGTIKITAETSGNTTLKVKIGNNPPIEMELEGKLKASFPYNVNEASYVYIYAGLSGSDSKHRLTGDELENSLKIYSLELKLDDKVDGDVNGDKQVNISDVVAIINTIVGNDTYKSTADIDRDGHINITDIVKVINIIAGL